MACAKRGVSDRSVSKISGERGRRTVEVERRLPALLLVELVARTFGELLERERDLGVDHGVLKPLDWLKE